MKIYGGLEGIKAPEPDYSNYDRAKEQKAEENYLAELRAKLVQMGYKGKHTGKIARYGVADGYAQYMLADGPKSFLIHLPFGDAYQYRGVEHFPKKEIIAEIERGARRAAMFGGRG